MPLLNMFRPRRGRSASLPRTQEGYWQDSAAYNQPLAYGSVARPTPSFNRALHRAPLPTDSRTQRYPPYGPAYPNSSTEGYSETLTDDQSWYRVEDADYYPHDRHGPRDRDTEYYSYADDAADRRSDASGARGVPYHPFTDSESSRVESPVPTVHRQETPGLGSRLFEQFPGHPHAHPPPGPGLGPADPYLPSRVTRLDLHEEEEEDMLEDRGFEDDAGFDRLQRGPPASHSQHHRHPSFASDPRRHHSHRRPPQPQHAFQGPVHVNPSSESSRSDVLQMLDDGSRIPIPRQPLERRRSGAPYVQAAKPGRTYYIVPPGMSVIFRDEYGNEIKRVGDFSESDDPDMYDEAPVELTDEHGHLVYKTGGNYTDDGSDVSDATYRPKVVHLGQYVSNGSAIPRVASPLTVSLDRRGLQQHIRLEHSEDGSFGSSQGSDRSFNPRLSHAHSEGNLAGFGSGNRRSRFDHVRLRTIYP